MAAAMMFANSEQLARDGPGTWLGTAWAITGTIGGALAEICIREAVVVETNDARPAGIAPGVVEATEAGTVPSLPLLVVPPACGEEPATIPAHDFG